MTATDKTINTFPSQHVKNLELDTGCAEVIFHTAPSEDIQIEARNLPDGAYLCEIRNDKLVVCYKPHFGIVCYPMCTKPQIILLFPESLMLEHISMNLGAGKLNTTRFPLSCHTMDVSIGAGKWRAKQLSVVQNLHIEVGAGSVNLQQTKAGSLKLSCGAGECFYHGEIGNGFQVDCAVGRCAFQLTNKEYDFDYDISCALGEIKINGRKLGHIASKECRSHENSLGKAVLQCGVGKITLETA